MRKLLDNMLRFAAWMREGGRTRAFVVLFFALGLVGTAVEGMRGAVRTCGEYFRPRVAWREAINDGVAVSLNALEKQGKNERRLPAMIVRGAVFDWRNRDWILWGDRTSARPGLPVDALHVAIRAMKTLDAPGVDIRPSVRNPNGETDVQKVTYFGGVESTVVGDWFFRFDHWMKSAALGYAPIPVGGIVSYWERLTDANQADVLPISDEMTSRNLCRFWLKNGDFAGVEDELVFTFRSTPLEVCAERLDGTSSPQASKELGQEDQFAQDLTTYLKEFNEVTPIGEIEEFVKLLAAVEWLAKADPYRDLSPWDDTTPQKVATTNQVATLRRGVEISVQRDGTGRYPRVIRTCELSGGVLLHPKMTLSKSADETLVNLRETILRSRPSMKAVMWKFTFLSEPDQMKGAVK